MWPSKNSLLTIPYCHLRANAECSDHPEVSHQLPPGFIKSSFSHLFAGALGIINPEEKELCFSGMLHWQEIEVRWGPRVESQQSQWTDEEGGIEDGGGIGENWAVVMDAMQGSGTLGLSVIKGPVLLAQTHTHAFTQIHLSSPTWSQTEVKHQLFGRRLCHVHCTFDRNPTPPWHSTLKRLFPMTQHRFASSQSVHCLSSAVAVVWHIWAVRYSLVGQVTKPTVNPLEKLFSYPGQWLKNWRGNKRKIRDFQRAFTVTSNINHALNFMPGFCLRDYWKISLIVGILNHETAVETLTTLEYNLSVRHWSQRCLISSFSLRKYVVIPAGQWELLRLSARCLLCRMSLTTRLWIQTVLCLLSHFQVSIRSDSVIVQLCCCFHRKKKQMCLAWVSVVLFYVTRTESEDVYHSWLQRRVLEDLDCIKSEDQN